MAIFGSKDKKAANELEQEIPETRTWAFATTGLKDFLKENPLTVSEPGYVKWDAEYGKDQVAVKGTITIPVELVFSVGDLTNEDINDDLKLESIAINGKKATQEIFEEAAAKFDPLATVDVIRAEAQAKKKNNL